MFATIRAMFRRKPAAPVAPVKVDNRPDWIIQMDERNREYNDKIKADRAAYAAAKPARVMAAMQRLIDDGELDRLALRYGSDQATVARAESRLAARGIKFN